MIVSQVTSQTFLPLLQGFLLCIGLIISIGPQNLFILKQGLHCRHLFVTALLCTLSRLLVIGFGVAGLGSALAMESHILLFVNVGGAMFLLGCGARNLHSAWAAPALAKKTSEEAGALSLKETVVATLTFSFLNPLVYLDMFMIGTASSLYPLDGRLFFGAGAAIAATLWFFILTYGSSRLTSLFRYPTAWRTLDGVSGCLMVGLAVSLLAT